MKKIKLFWAWIQLNEAALRNLQHEKPKVQKMLFVWLEKHLHYYCDGLQAILLLPTKENKQTELVITANGNPDYFPQVIQLIDVAPKLPDWKFTAFVQPREDIDELEAGLDKPYVFKDINLKASVLKFMPFQYSDSNKIDMIVYLKNFTVHCNNKNLLEAVFIIVQGIIGEKSLYSNINFVELAQMPEKESDELIYLYDLQFYLDDINNAK